MSHLNQLRLAHLLEEIEKHDADYAVRNPLILEALGLAARLGLPCGIGFDPAEGPDWPVVYIELPIVVGDPASGIRRVGQVSWHLPVHGVPYDGHTTAQKYDRCRAYHAVAWQLVER